MNYMGIVVAVLLATAAVGCKSQADKCLDAKIECIEEKCRAETKGEGVDAIGKCNEACEEQYLLCQK